VIDVVNDSGGHVNNIALLKRGETTSKKMVHPSFRSRVRIPKAYFAPTLKKSPFRIQNITPIRKPSHNIASRQYIGRRRLVPEPYELRSMKPPRRSLVGSPPDILRPEAAMTFSTA